MKYSPFLDEGIFAYGRSSGLATDFFSGIPAVDLVNKMGGALQSTAAPFRSDYDFSQSDFKDVQGLMFLQNAFGVRNVGNMILKDLPRESTIEPATLEEWLGIEGR